MTADQIRAWATALPEVTEKQHFRFKVPIWQVHGRTFLGMGRDETTAVFCITEESAAAAAAADPGNAAAVRRMDARRSFLGLELRLAGAEAERVEALVREAWTTQAPKTLARRYSDGPGIDPRQRPFGVTAGPQAIPHTPQKALAHNGMTKN